ncbi:hypothetical protein CONPUDRAFT_78210 [Coniophora puteana RWD-64-598 SS2]|uniref:DUF6533 domain-containing protein n=1 Tax=Coniophora puteana (strain RWD-64-598) TaxID=741705 RepID=R7SDL6_CONPW|nr:uncharacterized protein CONPUDRAFT_78210 [Coniophora puteana RWD-64-598 SS2]EIW74246.1 hypothetical protein CONPUDRAFT_78210 [Coniophora puteana RWD-64-598 SS2]
MSTSDSEKQLLLQVEALLISNYGLTAAIALMVYDCTCLLGTVLNMSLEARKVSCPTILYATLRYTGMIYGVTQFAIALLLLNVICRTTLTFLLQGLMALRVHVLLGKTKKIRVTLILGFVVSQIINIMNGVIALTANPGETSEASMFGVHLVIISTYPNLKWQSPVVNGVELAFEVLLYSLAVRYAYTRLPDACWKHPRKSATTLAAAIVRDNLVYFAMSFSALVTFTINTIAYAPATSSSPAYNSMVQIADVVFFTMTGPWMVLSLRKQFEESANARNLDSTEMSILQYHYPPPAGSSLEHVVKTDASERRGSGGCKAVEGGMVVAEKLGEMKKVRGLIWRTPSGSLTLRSRGVPERRESDNESKLGRRAKVGGEEAWSRRSTQIARRFFPVPTTLDALCVMTPTLFGESSCGEKPRQCGVSMSATAQFSTSRADTPMQGLIHGIGASILCMRRRDGAAPVQIARWGDRLRQRELDLGVWGS